MWKKQISQNYFGSNKYTIQLFRWKQWMVGYKKEGWR